MRKSRSLTNFRRLWRFLSLKETKSSLVSLTYILKIINACQDNVKHGKNCTVSYASLCGVIKLRSDSTSTWHDREGIKEREDGEKGGEGGGGRLFEGGDYFTAMLRHAWPVNSDNSNNVSSFVYHMWVFWCDLGNSKRNYKIRRKLGGFNGLSQCSDLQIITL